MDIKNIVSEIKTILDGLTGATAGDLFSVAYDYPKAMIESFPAIRVYPLSGGVQEVFEFNSTVQEMNVIIDTFFTFEDSQASFNTMLDSMKSLMIELNKQSYYTLNGEVYYFLVEEFEFYYPAEMDSKGYMGYNLLVNVKKRQETLP